MLTLLAIMLMVAAACTKKTDEADTGQTAPGETQDVEFPEIDRSELGEDVVVATYEGGEVRGNELAQYLAFQGFIAPHYPLNEPSFRTEALRFLIAERVIMAENVTEANKNAANERLDQIWGDIKNRYDDETRQKGLTTLQITEDEIQATLLRFLTVQDYFKQQTTDEDVRNFYNTVKADVTTADVRHILISTHENTAEGLKRVREDDEAKALADEIYQQLKGGADFAALAQEKSEDPGSKDNGGLYEGYPASQWAPGFKEAVVDQPVGEVGEPVQTMYGFHVIRVESRETMDIEEVRDAIIANITDEKFSEYFDTVLPDKIKQINI